MRSDVSTWEVTPRPILWDLVEFFARDDPPTDDGCMAHDRIVTPIFQTKPLTGRIVEPTEGWVFDHIPVPHDEADDPLIVEWFKIGELLSAEHELQAVHTD
jgi:hypothetical protein